MRISRLLTAAAFCGLTPAIPVSACSVATGYRIPTTLQLVDQADAIVLARVMEEGPSEAPGFAKARLVPIATLKGSALPREIRFDQAVISNAQLKATASDPRNLVDANPDAFAGGCNRYVFDEGMVLVAFLRRQGDHLVPDMSPFSRSLEDIPSEDALWVKAVKTYVRIAAFPKQKRREEMAYRRDMLASEIEDADSRLLALELNRALHEGRD